VRKPVAVLGLGVVALVLSAAIGFAVYDASSFQPRRSELQSLLQSGPAETVPVPVNLSRLVQIDAGGHLAFRAARQMLMQYRVTQESHGDLASQATWLLWTALVWLHYSEQEQIHIIVGTTDFGDGIRSYFDASRAVFHRPLSELSSSDLATLVAVAHSPSMARSNPGLVTRSRDQLLEKLRDGT
jgi:hypothetical protein